MKICSRCKTRKHESDFSRTRGYHGGVNAQCKDCRRKTSLESYYKRRESVTEKQRKKYYSDLEASRLRNRISMKRYLAKNRDKVNARKRELSKTEKYRAYYREQSRKLRAEGRIDKEKMRIYQQRYVERNLERVRISKKAYSKRYPERVKAATNNAKSRRRLAPGHVTGKQWKEILLFYGRSCGLCGISESELPLTVDHFIPIVKGGTNNWDNVWPLCMPCNMKKRDKLLDMPCPPHVAEFKISQVGGM